MTEREQHIDQILKEGARYGEVLLKQALKTANVKDTGGLIDSVRSITKSISYKHEQEIVLEFAEHMRYKDMKTLTYLKYTNTDAIIKYVQRHLNEFPYVSGDKRHPSQIPNADQKIAWAILENRRQIPTVIHTNNRRVYNKAKMILFNKIANEVRSINIKEGLLEVKTILSN